MHHEWDLITKKNFFKKLFLQLTATRGVCNFKKYEKKIGNLTSVSFYVKKQKLIES